MSDLLTSLVARNSRSAELIRPRLPSIFEPQGLAAGLPSADRFGASEEIPESFDETSEPNETPPVRASGPTSAFPRPGRRVEPRPVETALAPDVSGPVDSSLIQSSESRPDPGRSQVGPLVQTVESSPKTSRTPVGESSTQTPILRSLTQTPVDGLPTRNPVRESSSQTPVRETLVATTSKQTARTEVDRSRPNASIDWPAPAAERRKDSSNGHGPSEEPPNARILSSNVQADQISQLVKSIVDRRGASRSPDPNQGARPIRSTQSEPVIHVTIGRIEVRAMPEQGSARRERAVSPVMSLEDYLRSRQKRVRE
jgi:hypothetical protein